MMNEASTLGWKLSLNPLVVDAPDLTDFSVAFVYNGLSRGYGTAFGTHAGGDPIVTLWGGVGATPGSMTGMNAVLDGTSFS